MNFKTTSSFFKQAYKMYGATSLKPLIQYPKSLQKIVNKALIRFNTIKLVNPADPQLSLLSTGY